MSPVQPQGASDESMVNYAVHSLMQAGPVLWKESPLVFAAETAHMILEA